MRTRRTTILSANPPPAVLPDRADQQFVRELNLAVRLVTPMYGGGINAGEVDPNRPFRESGLMGQIQFWYRLVLRAAQVDPEYSWEDIFVAQRELFGAAADENRAYPSRVLIEFSNSKLERKIEWKHRENWGKLALKELDYVLYMLLEESVLTGTDNTADLSIKVVKQTVADDEHEQAIRINEPERLEAFDLAVRCWASFGGLGARTRRGLGAVSVTHADTGALLKRVNKHEAARVNLRVKHVDKEQPALEAWIILIKKWMNYRQPKKQRNSDGSSVENEWVDTGALKELKKLILEDVSRDPEDAKIVKWWNKPETRFEKLPLGLPIEYFRKKGVTKGKKKHKSPLPSDYKYLLTHRHGDRLASPLILRPVAVSENAYIPTVIRLPAELAEYDGDSAATLLLQKDGGKHRGFVPIHKALDVPNEKWRTVDGEGNVVDAVDRFFDSL